MKKKMIAAVAAGWCLLGFQAMALAQDLAEHPPFAPPARGLYNFYGQPGACNGTYDPYSDVCYPLDFQGPSHS